MPGLDRTGPNGRGSRTDRANGKCKSKNLNSNTDASTLGFSEEKGRGHGICKGLRNGRGIGRSYK